MKHGFPRGLLLLTALALTLSGAPRAMAQSSAGEVPEPFAAEAPLPEPVGGYSEGLVRVTDGARWGYADAAGRLVIPLQFDSAQEFEQGTAVAVLNGKAGLLRWDGQFLLRPEYDELTGAGYGVYLGRRGELWDLLSVTPVPSDGGSTHCLYAGLAALSLFEGTIPRLVLRSQEGETTVLPVSSLPQLLEQRRVPGWQFPLYPGRQAAFQDVSGEDWFDRWVNLAYGVGMMEGTGGGLFEPLRTLTVAEVLRLAACLESQARQDDFHLQGVSGSIWYSSSVAYCEAVGIISPGQFGPSDYERPVTRAEMARVFSAVTPVRGMEHRNDLERVRKAVPDVAPEGAEAEAVYALYAKGILQGADETLAFRPEGRLTRAEGAAIVGRIARPEQRITLW